MGGYHRCVFFITDREDRVVNGGKLNMVFVCINQWSRWRGVGGGSELLVGKLAILQCQEVTDP